MNRYVNVENGLSVTNVNIPNQGQIPNLPLGAVVETNAAFTSGTVTPVVAGEIPKEIYPLISRICTQQEVLSDAIAERNLDRIFEVFANDPLVTCSLSEAKELVVSTANAVRGYELKVESRTEKAEKQRREIDELGLEIDRVRSRAKMLDDLEKNMEGYSGSVKAVMREVKRGTLRGIEGVLSQLITVEEQYSVAIETALGNSLQNIVVDTDETAKAAIYALKHPEEFSVSERNRLLRAIVERIEYSAIDEGVNKTKVTLKFKLTV